MITTTKHPANPGATPCAQDSEAVMTQNDHHQDEPGQTVADLQTATVPREHYLTLRRARDADRKRADRNFVKLADQVRENHELRDRIDQLRDAKPDAAALLEARRDATELAHALASTLRVLAGVSKRCNKTSAYVHELLVNKGFDPAAVDVSEVAS